MECFAPLETRISDGSKLILLSYRNFAQIASRSSKMPWLAVYFVKFALMAAMAAFLISCGVGKSGSPAVRLTTSIPSAFMSDARAARAIVWDSDRLAIFFDRERMPRKAY